MQAHAAEGVPAGLLEHSTETPQVLALDQEHVTRSDIKYILKK